MESLTCAFALSAVMNMKMIEPTVLKMPERILDLFLCAGDIVG
jgi:hypothetical protein